MKLKEKQRLKKFAAKLAEIRKKKNLSQRELSYRCNVDYAKISKIENSKANLLITTLFELAEGLDVDPKELLDFEL